MAQGNEAAIFRAAVCPFELCTSPERHFYMATAPPSHGAGGEGAEEDVLLLRGIMCYSVAAASLPSLNGSFATTGPRTPKSVDASRVDEQLQEASRIGGISMTAWRQALLFNPLSYHASPRFAELESNVTVTGIEESRSARRVGRPRTAAGGIDGSGFCAAPAGRGGRGGSRSRSAGFRAASEQPGAFAVPVAVDLAAAAAEPAEPPACTADAATGCASIPVTPWPVQQPGTPAGLVGRQPMTPAGLFPAAPGTPGRQVRPQPFTPGLAQRVPSTPCLAAWPQPAAWAHYAWPPSGSGLPQPNTPGKQPPQPWGAAHMGMGLQGPGTPADLDPQPWAPAIRFGPLPATPFGALRPQQPATPCQQPHAPTPAGYLVMQPGTPACPLSCQPRTPAIPEAAARTPLPTSNCFVRQPTLPARPPGLRLLFGAEQPWAAAERKRMSLASLLQAAAPPPQPRGRSLSAEAAVGRGLMTPRASNQAGAGPAAEGSGLTAKEAARIAAGLFDFRF